MRVIAIMSPVLRSHVEEKLTAPDHQPKASRVAESTHDGRQRSQKRIRCCLAAGAPPISPPDLPINP